MILQKVRRLTIRIRNRGQVSKGKHETGVTTIVATRATLPAAVVPKVRRERPRRETIVVRKHDARDGTAAPGTGSGDPIERLVAEARERVFLLSRKSGGGVAQVSVLGRLSATGEISRRQHEAGVRYAGIVREHDALLGRNVTGNGAHGGAGWEGDSDDAGVRARYRTAMAHYDRCRAALREAGREDRMAAAVVDAVTVNNWELPELTPSLRIGLNHLARAIDAMGATSVVDARAGLPR